MTRHIWRFFAQFILNEAEGLRMTGPPPVPMNTALPNVYHLSSYTPSEKVLTIRNMQKNRRHLSATVTRRIRPRRRTEGNEVNEERTKKLK